jgi:hypothetical protein
MSLFRVNSDSNVEIDGHGIQGLLGGVHDRLRRHDETRRLLAARNSAGVWRLRSDTLGKEEGNEPNQGHTPESHDLAPLAVRGREGKGG